MPVRCANVAYNPGLLELVLRWVWLRQRGSATPDANSNDGDVVVGMDLAVAGRESESAEVSLPVMVSLPVFDPSPTHLGYVASEPEYVGRMVQHDDLVPIDPAVGCRVDYSTSDFEFPIQETNREEPEPRRPDFELIYDPSSESVGRIETGGEVEGVYVTGPVEHVGHILPRVDIPIMPKPPVKDRYHRLLHGSDDPEY